MQERPNILLYENEMNPYRFALYEELSRTWDLKVVFSRRRGKGRVWELDPDKYQFKCELLGCVPLGPFSINPSLPLRALGRYDAYIISGSGLQYIYGMLTTILAAKIRRRPSILWTEGFRTANSVPADYGWLHNAKRFLERQLYGKVLYRWADYFITHGQKPVEDLKKSGVSASRIFVTVSAVPELKEDPPTVPEDVSKLVAGKRVILTAAYFRKVKGIDGVIRAFRRLKGEDLSLIVMGGGREQARLESLAANDSRIHFVGYCEGQRKWAFFSTARIFVLFTYYDAWGLVVNEAMQCGCAIVTTDSAGCVTHLVRQDENGLIIKAGDEEALYRTLDRLTNDWDLVRKMGDRSKELIADFGIAKVAKDFVDAVQTWTNQRSRSVPDVNEKPASQVIDS